MALMMFIQPLRALSAHAIPTLFSRLIFDISLFRHFIFADFFISLFTLHFHFLLFFFAAISFDTIFAIIFAAIISRYFIGFRRAILFRLIFHYQPYFRYIISPLLLRCFAMPFSLIFLFDYFLHYFHYC